MGQSNTTAEKNPKKFAAYVVFNGRIPGIYETWNEARQQTEFFSGASFRGYATYDDAIAAWEPFEEGLRPEPITQEEKDILIRNGKLCPYCWAWSVNVDSAEVYNGRSYGPIWLCRPCKAWVGCHKGTSKALGRLADAELRSWKIKFHDAFDPLWKSGENSRSSLYAWLARKMGIPKEHCHGGMFDVEQCKRAISILGAKRIEGRASRLVASRSPRTTTCAKQECAYPACMCGL